MAVWQEKRLGDIINIKHGFAFKGEYISDEANGTVLVTPGNFHIGGGFKKTDKKFYYGDIPQDFILKPKDLIITMTDLSKNADTIGYAALIPNDNNIYLHNQRIGLVSILHNNINKKFIYWLLRTSSYQRQIANTSNGTNVKHTSPNRIYSYKCLVPDLSTQEKIADILSTYDDLIENNNRRIEILEQMAQEIYKEWFVRFRFPGHEKVKFINGLPEGWEIKKLKEFCFLTDGTHDSPKYSIYGIPLITGKNVVNGFVDFNNVNYISEIEHEKIKKRSGLRTGDIIYSNIGTIGNCCIVDYFREYSVKNMIIFKLQHINETLFLYNLLCSKAVKDSVLSKTSGSSQQFVGLDFMRNFRFIFPTKQLINLYGDIVNNLIKERRLLHYKNQNLIKQRDLLLPRLMNGKLEV